MIVPLLTLFLTALAVPELPTTFEANITISTTYQSGIRAYLWVTPEMVRTDTYTPPRFVSISRNDLGYQFTIVENSTNCRSMPLPAQQMYPFVIPGNATYGGTKTIEGQTVQLWYIDWQGPSSRLNYFVAVRGSRGILVRLQIDGSGFSSQVDFRDIIVAPIDPSIFDPRAFGCEVPTPTAGYNVSGYVWDTRGKPLDAMIYLNGARESLFTSTGTDGSYEWGHVQAGNYTLTGFANGYYPESRQVAIYADVKPGYQTNFMLSPMHSATNDDAPEFDSVFKLMYTVF